MTRFACAPTSEEVVVTSVTTVVSLTLLRAGQWELLAFALATGHKPSHCTPSSALKEVVVTGVTTGEPASKARGASRVCVS